MIAPEAIDLSARIIGVTVIVQSLEMLSLRREWTPGALWDWALLRREFAGSPLLAVLDGILGTPGFNILLGLRAITAVALVLWPHAGLAAFLVFTTIAIAFRWRGTFNGGSDAMTLIVLVGVTVGTAFADFGVGQGANVALLPGDVAATRSAVGAQAGLAYIAFQAVLSYFIAGVVKLRTRDWRNGSALRTFLNLPGYPVAAWLRGLSRSAGLMFALSWLLIVFECVFPLVFVWPRVFLVLGLAFHFGNAIAFGLNRFLLAWAAAYPALWYWAERWAQS